MNREFLTGKKVLVMGLGRFGGGGDVAKFASNAGANVVITDLASAEQLSDSINQLEEFPEIEYHLGSHIAADFEQADIIIVNPAVAPDNEFLQIGRKHNRFITSQINIFFELCPAPIIGITGANGKSTTAALTTHLLKAARDEGRGTMTENRAPNVSEGVKQKTEDRSQVSSIEHRLSAVASAKAEVSSIENVWLSGNIGDEPLLALLDKIGPGDLVVLELSSFQLEQLAQIKKAPKIALLTNLTPNHLDRHGTFTNYCAAKENIFKFQKLDENSPVISIFNAEDKIGAEWFAKYKNEKDRICIKFSTDDVGEEIRERFTLPGWANLSNLAAAVTIAKFLGIEEDLIKNCLPEFKPLPHRLELVAEKDGVRWYNDSDATTPQSAISALEAFEQPKIIIAGGYDKNLPFDELGRQIAQKARVAILIGQTAEKIADVIEKKLATEKSIKIEIVNSLAEAVDLARCLAVSGDVVLLSPGCASYDMFDNFQHRGREFTRLVREIST